MGQKAILMFDPDRRPEQVAFVTARTQILHQNGDQAWVVIDEGQAERMAAEGILVQFQPEADWIETPAIVFDPLVQEPQPPADLASSGPYAIVQFIATPQESWVSQIQEMGGALVQSVPVNGMVMRLGPELLGAVRGLDFVRWAGWYHPAYAPAFTLAGREAPFGALELAGLQVAAGNGGGPNGGEGSDRAALEIQFFDDRQPGERREAVEALGATVQTDTGYSLIVDIPPGRVRELLRVEGVASVEPHRPPDLSNFRALAVTQVNHVAQFRNPGFLMALDGTGETVGIIDAGLDAGAVASVHPDLAGRVLLLNNMNPGAASAADGQPNPQSGGRNVHGTHVAGTVAGSGSQSNGKVRGVAPAANIILQSAADPTLPLPNNGLNFRRFLSANLGFALAHQRGARVHTNSWGADSVNNRYVDVMSGNIDRFCYLNPEDLVLFAAGNSERDIAPADGVLDQGTVGVQGLAKNVVTVGASENVTSEGMTQTYNAFTLPPAVVLPATGRFGLVAGLNAPGGHPVSDNADHMAMFSDRGRVLLPAGGGGAGAPTQPAAGQAGHRGAGDEHRVDRAADPRAEQRACRTPREIQTVRATRRPISTMYLRGPAWPRRTWRGRRCWCASITGRCTGSCGGRSSCSRSASRWTGQRSPSIQTGRSWPGCGTRTTRTRLWARYSTIRSYGRGRSCSWSPTLGSIRCRCWRGNLGTCTCCTEGLIGGCASAVLTRSCRWSKRLAPTAW